MRNNLYENIIVLGCNNFGTAIVDGNFPASVSYIDTTNLVHFAFLIKAGPSNTALVCQVRQDTSATETASIKDVTGALLTVGATDDNKWMVIEVEVAKLDIANAFRFVTLAVSGQAGGDEFLDIYFLGWPSRRAPVTQSANFSQHVLIAG